MNKIKKLLELFLTFSKIGLFTFGGGYAMFPILQKEIVEKKHWASDEDLADYFAIGQCTPGIIAVNTATFVGIKRFGIIGGIVATLGFVFPSLIIIQIIAIFIKSFEKFQIIQYAFSGIRVGVCVLILQTVLILSKKTIVDKITGLIFLGVVIASLFYNISPIIIIIISAIIGVIVKNCKKESKKC